MSLIFEALLPQLTTGCCVGRIYALLYSADSTQALKPASGHYSLTSYVKDDHADYAIVLSENSQRTRFYRNEIADSNFTLADTAENLPYHIEIWRREIADANFDRDEDVILDSWDIHWLAGARILNPITTAQRALLKTAQAKLSISYDAEDNVARFTAWLEVGGELVADAQRVVVEWRNASDGEILANVNLPASRAITGMPGVFTWEIEGVALDPDNMTAATVKIMDAFGFEHTSVTPIVTWD